MEIGDSRFILRKNTIQSPSLFNIVPYYSLQSDSPYMTLHSRRKIPPRVFVFPPTDPIFSKGIPRNSNQSILSSSPIILPELRIINKKNPEKQVTINEIPKIQTEKKIFDIPEKKEKYRNISIKKESPKKKPLITKMNFQYLTIGEIIRKVICWRSYCYEDLLRPGIQIISKEAASKKVRLKKKSLDDYQMFLRLGISMGFNFKSNMDKGFNDLRRFIKRQPHRIHWDCTIHQDIESLDQITNEN